MGFGELETASDISLALLRNSAQPLMNGDFARFAACFKLPQTITTPEGMRTLKTQQDLRVLFDDVRRYFSNQGVQMITRNCVKADFSGEGTILSVHESYLVSPNGLLRPPYQVFSILQRHAEGWHIAFSDYALGDSLDLCRALSMAGSDEGQMPERAKTRGGQSGWSRR